MVGYKGVSQRLVCNLISGVKGLSYANHAKEHDHGSRRQCGTVQSSYRELASKYWDDTSFIR